MIAANRVFDPGTAARPAARALCPRAVPAKADDVLHEADFTADSSGVPFSAARFVTGHQLMNSRLWELFARQFVTRQDSGNNGWRGEYWGKMMRGACLTYSLTRDPALYRTLRESVFKMLSLPDPDGRISSYRRGAEFRGWDMWCRKYVLLGLEYFLDICGEEDLRDRIIAASCRHLRCIMREVGGEEGKKDITQTSNFWGGVNSCSILEPVIRLYELTGESDFLEFAEYIISTGGCDKGNLLELAEKGEIPPYRYPVVKAYEIMSFFEGIIEYYRLTGEERYLRAALNFTDAVLETDYTVIGCCGCTHELFDNSSSAVQTEARIEIMQETCVSVTFSKLLSQALLLTGDPKYAEAMEKTYYNSILGSVNFGRNRELKLSEDLTGNDYSLSAGFVRQIGGFTFDSYAPLYKNRRNRKTGGYQDINGGRAYGCCACIGSAGTALLPLTAILTRGSDGLVINQYTDGLFRAEMPDGKKAVLRMRTDYPYDGKITVTFEGGELPGELLLRIPSYGKTEIRYLPVRAGNDGGAGETRGKVSAPAGSYFGIPRGVLERCGGIELNVDVSPRVILLGGRAAVVKGCVVLAADCRNADIDTKVTPVISSCVPGGRDFPCRLSCDVTFAGGEKLRMTDYASAGADWERPDRFITAWLDLK